MEAGQEAAGGHSEEQAQALNDAPGQPPLAHSPHQTALLTFSDSSWEDSWRLQLAARNQQRDLIWSFSHILLAVLWQSKFSTTIDRLVWTIYLLWGAPMPAAFLLQPAQYARVRSPVLILARITKFSWLLWHLSHFHNTQCDDLWSMCFDMIWSNVTLPLGYELPFAEHLPVQLLVVAVLIHAVARRGGICVALAAGGATAQPAAGLTLPVPPTLPAVEVQERPGECLATLLGLDAMGRAVSRAVELCNPATAMLYVPGPVGTFCVPLLLLLLLLVGFLAPSALLYWNEKRTRAAFVRAQGHVAGHDCGTLLKVISSSATLLPLGTIAFSLLWALLLCLTN